MVLTSKRSLIKSGLMYRFDQLFLEDLSGLKRTLKWFTAVVLKRTDSRLCRCSSVTAVCRQLTVEEVDTGLVVANVLAVRQWWLEERQLVLACQLVKTAVVCHSVGS